MAASGRHPGRRELMGGALAIALGLGLLALIQLRSPVGGLGLYDGVVVEEPYRYLNPGPDQAGDPTMAQATFNATGAMSPPVVLATIETPPQAQLITDHGALAVPGDATSVTAAIEAVAPSAAQSSGSLVGNVYRYTITDDPGADVPFNTGRAATIVLRAPAGSGAVEIVHWDGTLWQPVATQLGQSASIVSAQITSMGDFSLQAAPAGMLLPILIGAAVLIALALVAGWWLIAGRRRRKGRAGS